jgi:hypothetical protein
VAVAVTPEWVTLRYKTWHAGYMRELWVRSGDEPMDCTFLRGPDGESRKVVALLGPNGLGEAYVNDLSIEWSRRLGLDVCQPAGRIVADLIVDLTHREKLDADFEGLPWDVQREVAQEWLRIVQTVIDGK